VTWKSLREWKERPHVLEKDQRPLGKIKTSNQVFNTKERQQRANKSGKKEAIIIKFKTRSRGKCK
jgi:hypothetical protein